MQTSAPSRCNRPGGSYNLLWILALVAISVCLAGCSNSGASGANRSIEVHNVRSISSVCGGKNSKETFIPVQMRRLARGAGSEKSAKAIRQTSGW